MASPAKANAAPQVQVQELEQAVEATPTPTSTATQERRQPKHTSATEAKLAHDVEAKFSLEPEAQPPPTSLAPSATPPPQSPPRVQPPTIPNSATHAPHMGSNIGSDSASDAETQEPVKKKNNKTVPVMAPHMEDSDVEEMPPVAVYGGDVIERIEAESDGEEKEAAAPVNSDENDVDFGDEEEEDAVVNIPQKVMEVEKEQDDEEEQEQVKEEVKAKKGKKKDGPAKTIKKTAAEGKAKGKATKAKGNALVRRKDASPKGKKKASSPKGSPKTSPKPQRKTVSKVSAKGAKATAKSKTKASKTAADKEKAVKPKKTIAKEDQKTTKKTLVKKGDKKSAVKTYSKKTSAASAKSSPKGKKAATAKKAKSEKATSSKSTKKGKKTKAAATPSKSSEEEDDEDMAVAESEEEDNSSDSDEEMEETTRTPAKLPILGNLACSSRDGNASALLDHAVQQLGKYSVVSYGPDSDCKLHAYIVGKETKRGWGVLQALACGVPLVSEDWLSSSISEGKWKPMDVFRSDQFGQSPRSVESAATGNRILDGQRVKVVSDNKDVASIRKLLGLCGARIAETRMDVVINDGGKLVDECVNVTKKWLADSVEAGEPLDYEGYVVET